MKISRNLNYLGKMLRSKSIKSIALSSASSIMLGMGLLACTEDPSNGDVAGGGGSGTEAGNAIIATILNDDGTPARLAKVTLVESNSLNGEKYSYKAEADSAGVVVIDSVPIGNYVMEAALNDLSMQVGVMVYSNDSVKLGGQKLDKPVYMKGTLAEYGYPNSESANGVLKFYGLSHSAEVVNGEFTIGSLPAGSLRFAFIPSNSATNDTIALPSIKVNAGDSLVTVVPKPGNSGKDEELPVEPEKVDTTASAPDTTEEPIKSEVLLIDDFTDGDNIHNMGTDFANSLNTSGAWFLIPGDNKMGSGPISVVPKVSNYTNPFADLIETTEDGNKRIHFSITFPDSQYQAYPPVYEDTAAFWSSYPTFRFMDSTEWVSQWWASFGLEVGTTGTSYDFSQVDSIAFDIWGKGSCTFEFIDENLKSGASISSSNPRDFIIAKQEIQIPSNKTRIAIALNDVFSEDQKRNVSMISWVFHDDGEMYFDNLEIIGQNLQGIWKK